MTHREREILDLIDRYQREHGGVSPTYEEMRVSLGLSSRSGVARLVDALVAKKLLRREAHAARSLVVVNHNPFDGIATSRIVEELRRRGLRVAACGQCDAIPGSGIAHSCTRTDCGLADRHHDERQVA